MRKILTTIALGLLAAGCADVTDSPVSNYLRARLTPDIVGHSLQEAISVEGVLPDRWVDLGNGAQAMSWRRTGDLGLAIGSCLEIVTAQSGRIVTYKADGACDL